MKKLIDMYEKWYKTGEKPTGVLATVFYETEEMFKSFIALYQKMPNDNMAKLLGTIAGNVFARREYYYDNEWKNISNEQN